MSFVAIRSALATSPDKGLAWMGAVIAGGAALAAIVQIVGGAMGG
jgi:hypothetical protein